MKTRTNTCTWSGGGRACSCPRGATCNPVNCRKSPCKAYHSVACNTNSCPGNNLMNLFLRLMGVIIFFGHLWHYISINDSLLAFIMYIVYIVAYITQERLYMPILASQMRLTQYLLAISGGYSCQKIFMSLKMK